METEKEPFSFKKAEFALKLEKVQREWELAYIDLSNARLDLEKGSSSPDEFLQKEDIFKKAEKKYNKITAKKRLLSKNVLLKPSGDEFIANMLDELGELIEKMERRKNKGLLEQNSISGQPANQHLVKEKVDADKTNTINEIIASKNYLKEDKPRGIEKE